MECNEWSGSVRSSKAGQFNENKSDKKRGLYFSLFTAIFEEVNGQVLDIEKVMKFEMENFESGSFGRFTRKVMSLYIQERT